MKDGSKNLFFLIISFVCFWLVLDQYYGNKMISKFIGGLGDGASSTTNTGGMIIVGNQTTPNASGGNSGSNGNSGSVTLDSSDNKYLEYAQIFKDKDKQTVALTQIQKSDRSAEKKKYMMEWLVKAWEKAGNLKVSLSDFLNVQGGQNA